MGNKKISIEEEGKEIFFEFVSRGFLLTMNNELPSEFSPITLYRFSIELGDSSRRFPAATDVAQGPSSLLSSASGNIASRTISDTTNLSSTSSSLQKKVLINNLMAAAEPSPPISLRSFLSPSRDTPPSSPLLPPSRFDSAPIPSCLPSHPESVRFSPSSLFLSLFLVSLPPPPLSMLLILSPPPPLSFPPFPPSLLLFLAPFTFLSYSQSHSRFFSPLPFPSLLPYSPFIPISVPFLLFLLLSNPAWFSPLSLPFRLPSLPPPLSPYLFLPLLVKRLTVSSLVSLCSIE